MRTADQHLEEALAEYNEKVNDLEYNGTREELFEALVNRSTILLLMESFTSSMSDIEEALDVSEEMLRNGEIPNIGSMVKLYENRGQMCYEDDNEQMVSDYMKIIPMLTALSNGARHYDRKGFLTMCIGCAEDLIDQDYCENSLPFIEKGLLALGGNYDNWSNNRRVVLLSLMAQAHDAMGLPEDALKDFTDCISIASKLYLQNLIEDEMELVLAFVHKGDIEEKLDMHEEHIADHESAIDVLEQLYKENKLDDVELLISLHQGIASVLIKKDEMKEAEKHLLRSMELGIPSMKGAIEDIMQEKKRTV